MVEGAKHGLPRGARMFAGADLRLWSLLVCGLAVLLAIVVAAVVTVP